MKHNASALIQHEVSIFFYTEIMYYHLNVQLFSDVKSYFLLVKKHFFTILGNFLLEACTFQFHVSKIISIELLNKKEQL